MSNSDTSYNGYTNYETWCVNLWLSNDEASYQDVVGMTEEAIRNTDSPTEAVAELADQLKTYIEESRPEVEGLYSDLLQNAIDAVNWWELAEGWVEEYKDDVVEEEE